MAAVSCYEYNHFTWLRSGFRLSVYERGVQSFLFGTDAGTGVLFVTSAAALIGMGAICLQLSFVLEREQFSILATDANATNTTDLPHLPRIGEQLWRMYGYFVDPGAQTGLVASDTSNFELFIAIVFSIFGFTWVLTAFGVLAERLDVLMKETRRRHARVVVANHILILGWTGKTLFLLQELAQMLTDGPNGGGIIVILGELDTFDMREEVHTTYRDFRQRWPRVQLEFWRGKCHEVDDLERVSVAKARHVLVLGTSKDARVADSLVISTLCALAVLEEKVRCIEMQPAWPSKSSLNPPPSLG